MTHTFTAVLCLILLDLKKESLLLGTIKVLFRVCKASFKYEECWENTRIRDNFREFSQPPECLDEAMKTRKKYVL